MREPARAVGQGVGCRGDVVGRWVVVDCGDGGMKPHSLLLPGRPVVV